MRASPPSSVWDWVQNVMLKHDTAACLMWPFSRTKAGYGDFRRRGKHHLAHRFACEAAHGVSPSGKPQAAHTCGNRACVNWRHLRWASQSENDNDKVRHGTHNRGEKHVGHKLTEKQVREIRSATGSQSLVAARFGVHQASVSQIKLRKRWTWLD